MLKQSRHYGKHPLYYCHSCRTESLYYTSYEWLYDLWLEITARELTWIWMSEEELEPGAEEWTEFSLDSILPNGLCICGSCEPCQERPYYLEYQQPPEGGGR